MSVYTLRKAERLNSKILIGKMFEGGNSKSFSIFPIRVVYMPIEQGEAPATILISVSKRLAIAFIYLSDELVATAELEEKMKIALSRISEKLSS